MPKSPCTGFEKEKGTDKAITTFCTKEDFKPIFNLTNYLEYQN